MHIAYSPVRLSTNVQYISPVGNTVGNIVSNNCCLYISEATLGAAMTSKSQETLYSPVSTDLFV
jgi:hypothetical protein